MKMNLNMKVKMKMKTKVDQVIVFSCSFCLVAFFLGFLSKWYVSRENLLKQINDTSTFTVLPCFLCFT